MFYKLPLQIQTIEGALLYKIAPLTPPNMYTMGQPLKAEKMFALEDFFARETRDIFLMTFFRTSHDDDDD